MSSHGRRLAVTVTALGLGALLAPVQTHASTNRTHVFELDRSLYPAHVYLAGRVTTNHGADHLIGTLHRSSFDELGRHPEHGWLQGAVWEPKVTVRGQDGSKQRLQLVITTAYVVSEYDSPAAAHAAVQDLIVRGARWQHLNEGADGQIFYQKDAGYSVIGAGFSQGIYDIEDITLAAPRTPRVYYRQIKAAVLNQLAALQRIAASFDGATATITPGRTGPA
jgi:hypothetical protein